MEVENKELAWLGLESNPDMMNEFAKKLGLSEEYQFGDIFVCKRITTRINILTWRAFLKISCA
jgi:hypothetical protein